VGPAGLLVEVYELFAASLRRMYAVFAARGRKKPPPGWAGALVAELYLSVLIYNMLGVSQIRHVPCVIYLLYSSQMGWRGSFVEQTGQGKMGNCNAIFSSV
jgi:hypothetical protein